MAGEPEIEPALKDASFDEWKREVGREEPALLRVGAQMQESIVELGTRAKNRSETEFQEKLRRIFEMFQNSRESATLFDRIARSWQATRPKERERKVRDLVLDVVRGEMGHLHKNQVAVTQLDFLDDRQLNCIRFKVNIDSVDLEKNYDLWISVPIT